eukprot:5672549-Alexandrium_andersonii.AAC.1
MSASLVGSEMCIRDSGWPALPQEQHGYSKGSWGPSGSRACPKRVLPKRARCELGRGQQTAPARRT